MDPVDLVTHGVRAMTKTNEQIQEDAERFVSKCRQSKAAWERGNNSGDPAKLAEGERLSNIHGTSAELIAALYGCRCTWPGLWPVLERAAGDQTFAEYSTSDAGRVARFFAEAQAAKVRP